MVNTPKSRKQNFLNWVFKPNKTPASCFQVNPFEREIIFHSVSLVCRIWVVTSHSNISFVKIGLVELKFPKAMLGTNNFINLVNFLIFRMKKQGIRQKKLVAILKNALGKHFNLF